jgi:hypothetical protein
MSSNTHYLDELDCLDSASNRFFVENTKSPAESFRPGFRLSAIFSSKRTSFACRRTIEIQPVKVRFSLPADPAQRSNSLDSGSRVARVLTEGRS